MRVSVEVVEAAGRETRPAGDFGALDADEDALLRECLQGHPAYLSARTHDRWLIIGRKGTGKTAIFKRLITDRAHDRFSFGHTFDDYPWEYHDLQAQVGVPEERRYFNSWKYLMLLGLAKILLNQDQSQPWAEGAVDALGNLEEFVVDSYGSRDPDVTQLFRPDRELRFKGFNIGPFGGLTIERIIVREFPTHVQEVNRTVQEAVIATLSILIITISCVSISWTSDSPSRIRGTPSGSSVSCSRQETSTGPHVKATR
jgi:hypothetical protein